MTGEELGRLSPGEVGHPVLHDAPEKQMQAVMSKLDELVDVIKALTAKLDADGGVDTDYAAEVTASLSKIQLFL